MNDDPKLEKRAKHTRITDRRTLKNYDKDEQRRTVSVSVRLTPDEAALLDERRGSMQRGAFMREIFLRSPNVLRPLTPALNREAYVELARAAATLHDINHRYNKVGDIDVMKLRQALAVFRLKLIDAMPMPGKAKQ